MLITFILIVYGITNIIVNEKVLEKPLNWLKRQSKFIENMLNCPTCASFWVGLCISILITIPITDIFVLNIILCGLLASGSVNLIEHIKIRFE